MVGLILAAVGTVVSAVGGAVRKGQERKAVQIGVETQQKTQAMQRAYDRIAQKNQALQDYSVRLSNAQMQAYKRERTKTLVFYGLPLIAGIFVLIAVNMRRRKGKKK